MARNKQNSRKNKSPVKSKKNNNSYKINDFHYRFDGGFKKEKVKHQSFSFQNFQCTSEDVHDIAINVFGKTYYIGVGEL